MAQIFDKRLKNVLNDLEISEMAKIFGKWFRYIARLKYLRNGISMWQVT